MAKKSKARLAEGDESTGLVPVIKKTAISADIGPMVIAGFAKTMADEKQANQLLMQVSAKRYDLLGHLTAGILKAAKADSSIDLGVAFDKDPKKQGYLNDQLGLALGFKAVQTLNGGTKEEKHRVAWSKEVSEFVLSTSDEKGTDTAKAKNTLRSNFLHALKKCAQAAAGIIEQKMNAKMDDKAGTLQLSGPAVKAMFGQPTVHLNEKQTVGDVKLTEKPSFTAIAAKAAEKRGAVIKRGSNTRGRSQQLANPTAALEDMTKAYLSMVNKLASGKLLDTQIKLMKQVQDRLAEVLD
jgi:hypothetical protein